MDLAAKIRAFIALRLSPETDRALSDLIKELRARGDGINWARPDNLHVTIRFLGAAVDTALIPPLVQALNAVAIDTAQFEVAARGIGAFPGLARPRVIWVGLESDDLVRLARSVEEAAVRSGFEPERRPYSAHLTLGRVRDLRRWPVLRRKIEAAAARDFGRSKIDSMTLYESRLASSGATYRAIQRFEFAR